MFHAPLLSKNIESAPTSGTIFTDGFEGCSLSNFTKVNTTNNNKWYAGTAIDRTGSCSAYCSNGSSSIEYDNQPTGSQVSHMYVDLAIPSNATKITIKFYWTCEGEDGYDTGFVGLSGTSFTPSATEKFEGATSTRQRLGEDVNDGDFNQDRATNASTSWIYEIFEVENGDNFFTAGGTIRLWFGFFADSSVGGGSRRTFCIDDIEVTWVDESGGPGGGGNSCGGDDATTGTSTSGTNFMYGLWDYFQWLGLYLDTEVGDGSTKSISSIEVDARNYTANYTFTGIKIYMYHTTQDEFTNVPTTNLSNTNNSNKTLVFDGDITIRTDGYLQIDFDTSFVYNGTDNVIVEVKKTDGSNDSGYGALASFICDSSIDKRNVRGGDGSAMPTSLTRGNDWLVNMKFNCL